MENVCKCLVLIARVFVFLLIFIKKQEEVFHNKKKEEAHTH